MTSTAFSASNPPAASPLPGSAVDIVGCMPTDPALAAPDFDALAQAHLVATGRNRSRYRCEARDADPRFHTSPGSPELQRMALVAALSVLISGCSVLPEGRALSRAAVSQPARAGQPAVLAPPSRTETRQCIAALAQAQVQFTPVPDQTFGAGCSQLGSVRLSTISLSDAPRGASDLAISNIGPVRCELAQRFAGWAQFGIARAAEQMLGSPLVRIETMGSYSCRTIAGSARLSQHAHANAIDIAAFVLADGRRISVKQGWNGTNQERAFLRTIHASACKRFGTVLGPNYNAAHHDHLHVDMSGQGYCR